MARVPAPYFAAKRKALRGQMAQQIDMFDRLADPLLQVTRRKGQIKWANRAAVDLLGADLVDQRLDHVFASKALKAALGQLCKSTTTQQDLISSAKNLPDREFRIRLVGLERKTFYGARILISLTEITEVMRLQRQRADFVANASHELKTPVAALSGSIETLQQDPKALQTFLPLMAQEAERMRALIRDLLRLTRTEMEEDTSPSPSSAPGPPHRPSRAGHSARAGPATAGSPPNAHARRRSGAGRSYGPEYSICQSVTKRFQLCAQCDQP